MPSVNSVTPGCAITVNDGGRFVSNGGEYYGRNSLHWDGLIRLRGAQSLRVWTLDLYFEGDMIYIEDCEEE